MADDQRDPHDSTPDAPDAPDEATTTEPRARRGLSRFLPRVRRDQAERRPEETDEAAPPPSQVPEAEADAPEGHTDDAIEIGGSDPDERDPDETDEAIPAYLAPPDRDTRPVERPSRPTEVRSTVEEAAPHTLTGADQSAREEPAGTSAPASFSGDPPGEEPSGTSSLTSPLIPGQTPGDGPLGQTPASGSASGSAVGSASDTPDRADADRDAPAVPAALTAPAAPSPLLPTPETATAPALTLVDDAPADARAVSAEEEPSRYDFESGVPQVRRSGISAHLAVLTALATAMIMGFLLIEPSPRWLLLLGAAATVFGLDGTLRQTWREPFAFGQETAPFLFVPALYMLAVPVLIEHNVSGELVFLVGMGAGLGFGALVWAEVASVRPMSLEYDQARLIVTANTYLTGFAIFSLSYVFDIGLPAAIIATGIAASMLAVEVLREGEIDPLETLGLSLVTGVVLAEARWLLYYVPLDTYLAGLTLLLVFYLATGLLHSHVIRTLNRVVALEYSGIATAGLALVILARTAGLA